MKHEKHASMVDDEMFFCDVMNELRKARKHHPPIFSIHEGYAIILEEVDELWDQVRKRTSKRDLDNVYKELIQIAAMTARTWVDVYGKQRERDHE